MPTKIAGPARNVQWRTVEAAPNLASKRSETTLSFRIDLEDTDGTIVERRAVNMNGRRIVGVLDDGDHVEVLSGRERRGVMQAYRIRNHSTNSELRVSGVFSAVAGLKLVGFLVVLAVAAVIAFFVWSAFSDRQPLLQRLDAPPRIEPSG